MTLGFRPLSNTGLMPTQLVYARFSFLFIHLPGEHVNQNLLLLALILGFHLEPAWALLLIVIAVGIKILPLAIALEIVGPTIISYIQKHRRNQHDL